MEFLYKKRINYASINMIKNYCQISKKHLYQNAENIFGSIGDEFVNILIPPKIKNRRTKFFHTNDNGHKHGHFERVNKTIWTNDDEKIKKYYGKPFVQITTHFFERKIVRNGDKITMKIFKHMKIRDYNALHFHYSTIIISITFNTKTGNINQTLIQKHNKGLTKTFRVNNFILLSKLLTNGLLLKKIDLGNHPVNQKLQNDIDDFNDIENFINIFLKECGIQDKSDKPLVEKLLDKFIELKKIKLPNNTPPWLIPLFYPNEDYLKKNDRKLLNSILNKFGIKSKKTIRLFNENPNLNVLFLTYVAKILGNNYGHYLNNIKIPEFNVDDFKSDDNTPKYFYTSAVQNLNTYNLDDHNKKRIVKLLNESEFTSGNLTSILSRLNLLRDHIEQLNKLIEYGVDVKFKFNNFQEFHTEHLSFSRLLLQVKREYYGIKTYNSEAIKEIDTHKTYIDHETNSEYRFSFKLLTTELEYIDEGTHMHHCVASYFDNKNSIIVSIRDSKSKDRVTCEYNIKTGALLQSRYFCNQEPPPQFNNAIVDLTSKINRLAKKDLLKVIETTRIKSNTYIDEVFF
jgi:hypothetical protein